MISLSIIAIIMLICALTMQTISSQQTLAVIGGQSGGLSGANGGASGPNRHLFYNTGVITPVCN
jgi:preprotein translocase subunit SecG